MLFVAEKQTKKTHKKQHFFFKKMAEPTVKMTCSLVRSPQMRVIARELNCKKLTAVGLALTLFCWLSEYAPDGNTNLTGAELDEELGFAGASNAFIAAGWAHVNESGYFFVSVYNKKCIKNAIKTTKNETKNAKKATKNETKNEEEKSKNEEKAEKNSENEPKPHACEHACVRDNDDINNINNINNICLCQAMPSLNNNSTVFSGDEAPQPGLPARTCKPLPQTAEEVRSFMGGQALCSLPADELEACAAGFFDEMEAQGWTSRHGAPLFDWHAVARKYLRSWQTRTVNERLRSQAALPLRATTITYRSETTPDYSL